MISNIPQVVQRLGISVFHSTHYHATYMGLAAVIQLIWFGKWNLIHSTPFISLVQSTASTSSNLQCTSDKQTVCEVMCNTSDWWCLGWQWNTELWDTLRQREGTEDECMGDIQIRRLTSGRCSTLSWGRDCWVGVESDETAAAGFCLHCGALWLLSNDQTGEGENTYAAVWFGFTIGHTSCAVEGRGRRPSSVVPSSCGWGQWDNEKGVSWGVNLDEQQPCGCVSRRIALCRSVRWGTNWPSIVRVVKKS